MTLNFIRMKCIKTNDGIHEIIYNEECDVHDSFVSDVRDHLLTFDLDLSTTHIDEMTCMRSDRYMRCKWGRVLLTWQLLYLWVLAMAPEGDEGDWDLWGKEVKHKSTLIPESDLAGLSEVIHVESVTTKSAYLARVRQTRRHWPIVGGCLTLILLLKLSSCRL